MAARRRPRSFVEGTWFAVPLESGAFGVGVIARARRRVLFIYLFGPARERVPTLPEVEGLHAGDAVLVLRTGDLDLRSEKWPVIGVTSPWQRAGWPMPLFVRDDPLTGRIWLSRYSEDDPVQLLGDTPADPKDAEGLPSDALWGGGAVERRMSKLLAQ